jgi:hypothetical protein
MQWGYTGQDTVCGQMATSEDVGFTHMALTSKRLDLLQIDAGHLPHIFCIHHRFETAKSKLAFHGDPESPILSSQTLPIVDFHLVSRSKCKRSGVQGPSTSS